MFITLKSLLKESHLHLMKSSSAKAAYPKGVFLQSLGQLASPSLFRWKYFPLSNSNMICFFLSNQLQWEESHHTYMGNVNFGTLTLGEWEVESQP